MWLIVVLTVAVVATLLSGYAIWVEPNWLRVRRRTLFLENWDPALDGLTILHMSDLHFGSASRVSRLVGRAGRANALSADFVVITGDFVSTPSAIGDCLRAMREVADGRRVFGVLGNHEYQGHRYGLSPTSGFRVREIVDTTAVLEGLGTAGLRMLVNEHATIEHGSTRLTLVGIDDLKHGQPDLDTALDGVESLKSLILLCHSPDILDRSAELGIPLVLSGHTHGGQVRFPPLGTPTTATKVPLERPYGVIQKASTTMHISPGLGTSWLPIRFFARPEITLLELRAATNASD